MASGYDIQVTIIGQAALERTFERAPAIVDKRLREAMNKSVKTVEGEVKQRAPVGVSARLRNSIAGEVSGFGSDMVGRVGSTLRNEVYPEVMEYGRKPGKMPPVDALVRWVHLQLGVQNEEARGVAFIIARSIARKGIKGKFFFKAGWERSEARVRKFFKSALTDIVQDMRAVK